MHDQRCKRLAHQAVPRVSLMYPVAHFETIRLIVFGRQADTADHGRTALAKQQKVTLFLTTQDQSVPAALQAFASFVNRPVRFAPRQKVMMQGVTGVQSIRQWLGQFR